MSLSSLHIINHPDSWKKSKPLITSGDAVIFIQDSVYLLPTIKPIEQVAIYGRLVDCEARNIDLDTNKQNNSAFTLIDDNKWVELVEIAQNTLTW